MSGEISTNGSANGSAWKFGDYGAELNVNNTSNGTPFWTVPLITTPLTFLVFAGASAATGDVFGILNDPTGSTNGLIMTVGSGGTAKTTVQWIDAGGTTTLFGNIDTTLSTTDDNVVICSLLDEGGTSTYSQLCVNGMGSVKTGATSRTPSMTKIRLGANGTGANAFNNSIHCGIVWNCLLSLGQMLDLCADPFLIFRRKTRISVLVSGVPAGVPTKSHYYRQRRVA